MLKYFYKKFYYIKLNLFTVLDFCDLLETFDCLEFCSLLVVGLTKFSVSLLLNGASLLLNGSSLLLNDCSVIFNAVLLVLFSSEFVKLDLNEKQNKKLA